MKSSLRYRLIAVLSTISIVGGIVISASVAGQIKSAVAEQSLLYLPATSLTLPETSTPQISRQVVKSSEFIGTISIPRLKRTIKIFEGTDSKSLAKGVGHYIRSVMPGRQDNSVLAGHRDTVFSHLDKVKIGDFVVIGTGTGTYIYQVKRIRIVDKNDLTVIVPTSDATLTLSTCYPFRFIGNAPKRYIVSASLVPEEISEVWL